MKRTILFTGILSGVFVTTAVFADKVEYTALPPAVQNSVNGQRQGAQIEDIDRETKDGRTVYEVHFKRDGKNTELKIAEDGSIIKNNRNNRLSAAVKIPKPGMQFSDLPAAVQKTVIAQAGTAEIADIDKETRDGRTVYEVEFERKGRNNEIVVAEDGTLVGQPASEKVHLFGGQEVNELRDLPLAVQSTIRRQSAGNPIADIDTETKNGHRVFEVEFEREGRNQEVRIAEDGSVLNEPAGALAEIKANIKSGKVQLSGLPEAAQRTVRAQTGGAAIDDIDRETKDGRVIYEVGFKRDGKHQEIRVGEDGALIQK